LKKLIDDIEAGNEVTPGPQNGRHFSMAEGGQTSLTEMKTAPRAPCLSRMWSMG
jgi:hypothetical protein